MSGQSGFFDAEERLRWLSASVDPLVRLRAVVDFEVLRATLDTSGNPVILANEGGWRLPGRQ